MQNENRKILGIDYGESKVGLAISQGEIAQPYGVIKASNISQIISLCQKEEIKKIIIGISEGRIAEKIKKFAYDLQKKVGLPVEYWDETLSSQEAIKKMVQVGKKKSRRKTNEHAFAAALILQDYLENNKLGKFKK